MIRGSRVVRPDGVGPAAVFIRNGTIVSVSEAKRAAQEARAGAPVFDAGDLAVSPGTVDTHVHINEPGRSEWEGFACATAAAAAGGTTTLVDMPLNSRPVTTTPAALAAKIDAARDQCRVDVGFYGGLVPGNLDQLRPLVEAGVLGIKAFLCPSGLEEFPPVAADDLAAAMAELAGTGVPLLVHSECVEPQANPSDPNGGAPVTSYPRYLASRPDRFEMAAIELLIQLCRRHRCRLHIVHLSSALALVLILSAQGEGLPLTVETCPHYLHFTAADVAAGDTRFKCAPPIRKAANREALWGALKAGYIDTIGSDHSPCPPAMKRLEEGDFDGAWGGIASLQWMLPIVWAGARRRGAGLLDLAAWLSEKPARLVGLGSWKGRIAEGCHADLVIWDPEAEVQITGAKTRHRHSVTPYDGETGLGVVHRTYLRGCLIYRDGDLLGPPQGRGLLSGGRLCPPPRCGKTAA